LGIKLFEDKKLDEFLGNEKSMDNLVAQVKSVVMNKKFDGVNIDFEYQGDPTAILNPNFFGFLERIRKAEVGEISVDVFVNTINKGSQADLIDLLNKTDELIIMAYDFHRPGVDYTGAVAPIEAPMGERSILELVKNITNDGLSKNKIILAYPLYGYEWKTYTQEFGSQIKRGWYQMSSWQRTKKLVNDENLEVKWDDLSMTPWLVFEEEGQIHQIYYENEKSLKIKIKLAEDNQFKGVGFWALGYEGEDILF
jgi:spore germination protein YaaH